MTQELPARDLRSDHVNPQLKGAWVVAALLGLLASTAATQSVVRTDLSPNPWYVNGYGENAAAIGDVDHDGVIDYAVAYSYDADFEGFPSLFVRSGIDGSILSSVSSPLPPGYLPQIGTAIDGPTDINQDGQLEILASGPYGSTNGFGAAGTIYLINATTGITVRQHTVGNGFSSDGFGYHAALLGDLNGDGVREYAASTHHVTQHHQPPIPDSVYVFDGASGQQLAILSDGTTFTNFGLRIHSLNDIDLDGVPDFGVGAPATTQGANVYAGAIYTYSGQSFTPIQTVVGTSKNAGVGYSIADLGDLNQNGTTVIATGYTDTIVSNAGVQFYHLPSGTPGLYVPPTPTPKYFLGRRLATADDMDGDGCADLLAAEWYQSSGNFPAKLVAIGSRTGKRIFEHKNTAAEYGVASDNFPNAIAFLGDVDSDSIGDWLISDPITLMPQSPTDGMSRIFSRRALYSKDDEISPVAGPTVAFELNAGVENAGRLYALLASYTGTSGIPVGSTTLPLSYDVLTEISLFYANTPVFESFQGTLDHTGRATATFDGALFPPAVQGLTFYFAYLVHSGVGPFVASNAHAVLLNPLGL